MRKLLAFAAAAVAAGALLATTGALSLARNEVRAAARARSDDLGFRVAAVLGAGPPD